jgi:protein-S-isoprenylcysteine O-methyltransferase Ste14
LYVGNLAIVLSEALAFRSPGVLLYAALLSLLTRAYVSRVEERALEARYGEAYRRYRDLVPRWLPWNRPASGPGDGTQRHSP